MIRQATSDNQQRRGKWYSMAVLGIIACSVAMRVSRLEDVPHGFYIDEAMEALNVLCVAQSGISAFGEKWPLFGEVMLGNWTPPTFVYPGALWLKVFGASIYAMRLFVAALVLATIVAVFLAGRQLAGFQTGVLSALAALLAPWSFQAGRVYWKCPLAAMFTMWALVCFLEGRRTRSHSTLVIAALLFALSVYSYQAAWAFVPLLCLFLCTWCLLKRSLDWRLVGTFGVALILALIPWIVLVENGSIVTRIEVGVFDGRPLLDAFALFALNFLKHLNPLFLFVHGDKNLRHGVGNFGQLSWLDAAALLIVLVLVVRRFVLKKHVELPATDLCVIGLVGFLVAIVPAALTNEGIPHALRAGGAWPFAALLTGGVCAVTWRWSAAGLTVIAVGFLLVFGWYYFTVYPMRSAEYFDAPMATNVMEQARKGDREKVAELGLQPIARVALMAHGGMDCLGSKEFWLEVQGRRREQRDSDISR